MKGARFQFLLSAVAIGLALSNKATSGKDAERWQLIPFAKAGYFNLSSVHGHCQEAECNWMTSQAVIIPRLVARVYHKIPVLNFNSYEHEVRSRPHLLYFLTSEYSSALARNLTAITAGFIRVREEIHAPSIPRNVFQAVQERAFGWKDTRGSPKFYIFGWSMAMVDTFKHKFGSSLRIERCDSFYISRYVSAQLSLGREFRSLYRGFSSLGSVFSGIGISCGVSHGALHRNQLPNEKPA